MTRLTRPGAASGRTGSRRHAYWRRHARRLTAALLAALAAVIVVAALRANAADATAVPVVVVNADLWPGHRLTAQDLQVRQVPSAARPPGAFTVAEAAVGRSLIGPIVAGEVVTSSRVAPVKGLAGVAPGHLAIAVPLANPAVLQMISTGDEVLVLESGSGARVTEAVVLQTANLAADAGTSSTSAPGAWSMASPTEAALFVAVPESDAARVAAAFGPAGSGAGFVVAVRP